MSLSLFPRPARTVVSLCSVAIQRAADQDTSRLAEAMDILQHALTVAALPLPAGAALTAAATRALRTHWLALTLNNIACVHGASGRAAAAGECFARAAALRPLPSATRARLRANACAAFAAAGRRRRAVRHAHLLLRGAAADDSGAQSVHGSVAERCCEEWERSLSYDGKGDAARGACGAGCGDAVTAAAAAEAEAATVAAAVGCERAARHAQLLAERDRKRRGTEDAKFRWPPSPPRNAPHPPHKQPRHRGRSLSATAQLIDGALAARAADACSLGSCAGDCGNDGGSASSSRSAAAAAAAAAQRGGEAGGENGVAMALAAAAAAAAAAAQRGGEAGGENHAAILDDDQCHARMLAVGVADVVPS
ncbi:hypothetical protein JKP88DRAFT_276915 [Tribonema minus]|uniref:Uncharacterized protein n=1 Tax=Tribonema minus TaxID=303371 RepID=A0A835Z4P7_9STRA|nr:hypothetical protein JKP88DRAFT_276915 [Tribonema minus]